MAHPGLQRLAGCGGCLGSDRLAEDQREQVADVNVTTTGLTPEVIDKSGDSLKSR